MNDTHEGRIQRVHLSSAHASSIHTYEIELLQTPRAPQASSPMPSDGDAVRDSDQGWVLPPLLDNEEAEAEEEEEIRLGHDAL